MTDLVSWVAIALISVGLLFSAIAVLGLLRMPDVYTRAHATSKTDTLGTVLTLAGVALTFPGWIAKAKLLLLALFLLATNPTATHAITRAAYDQGIEPWTTDSEGSE